MKSLPPTISKRALGFYDTACRKLLDSLPQIVFVIDASGRIEFLNKAWQTATGYPIATCVGESFERFMPAIEFSRLLRNCSGVETSHEVFCFINAKGNEIQLLSSLAAFKGGYLGTLHWIDRNELQSKSERQRSDCYSQIVEACPDILFQMDRKLRLEYVNQMWTLVSGHSEAETLGRALQDFVADPCLKLDLVGGKIAPLPIQVYRQGIKLRCKNGSLRAMYLSIKPCNISSDGNCLFTGTLVDISENEELEQSLRLSEERYTLLASSTTDGIWDWDLATDQVYFSPRWKAMIGYEDHEIENVFDSWYQRVHPQDARAAMDEVQACLEGRKVHYENIHRLRHKDRSWRWILARGIVQRDEQGAAQRMVGTHADVTELKKTTDSLQQRENELEAIFSISPDGIVTINQDGYVQSVNPAFLDMTGFGVNKVLGLREYDFDLSLRDISKSDSSQCRPGSFEKQVYCIELHKARAHQFSRTPAKLHDKLNPDQAAKTRILVRTERQISNQEIAKVLYFRDISVECEVDQMKSQFLSTAAHELRSPMASVFGFSELLLCRDFDPETRQEIVATIHQQSGALVDMLNQLLDLARIESRMGMDFSFSVQSLWPIVERSVGELLIPGDTRKVVIQQPVVDYQVSVDSDKLRQVLINVLVNAYKYSPHGGKISLELGHRINNANEAEVGIAIKDHGLGMSEDQLKHVFERFWRADNSGAISGTGLGMSLVKEIMDIHQGSVEIKSQLDRGTIVTLWLKIVETQ